VWLLPCSGDSTFDLVCTSSSGCALKRCGDLSVQMMGGGDKTRQKPRIDFAIPMALVSKSVTSELNRPGAKGETLHGEYSR
jgi:hypothetical protein